MNREYEDVYVEQIARLEDPGQRDAAQAGIVETARGLLATYLYEQYGHVAVTDPDRAADALTDASMDVLRMADEYDPERGPFTSFLTARAALWRRTIDQAMQHGDHAVRFSDGERKILRVAWQTRDELLAQGRVNVPIDELAELISEKMDSWEAEDPAREGRNKRSGVAAALRNLPELLQAAQAMVHPDTDESLTWDTLDHGAPAALDAPSPIVLLAGLGDADSDEVPRLNSARRVAAEKRLTCPHAQYAYLSGAGLHRAAPPVAAR